MNTKKLLFVEVSPEELQREIIQGIKSELLEELKKSLQFQQTEMYYTRKEVAELFKVDISTIHNWTKSGKLKPYGLGNRVYFLHSDISKSLKPLCK